MANEKGLVVRKPLSIICSADNSLVLIHGMDEDLNQGISQILAAPEDRRGLLWFPEGPLSPFAYLVIGGEWDEVDYTTTLKGKTVGIPLTLPREPTEYLRWVVFIKSNSDSALHITEGLGVPIAA